MRFEFVLPQAGMGMSEGTVGRWHYEVGATIVVGQPLVDIETEKIEVEIEAPVAGTLTEILVEADTTVDVGTVLAVIEIAEP